MPTKTAADVCMRFECAEKRRRKKLRMPNKDHRQYRISRTNWQVDCGVVAQAPNLVFLSLLYMCTSGCCICILMVVVFVPTDLGVARLHGGLRFQTVNLHNASYHRLCNLCQLVMKI